MGGEGELVFIASYIIFKYWTATAKASAKWMPDGYLATGILAGLG